MLFKKDKLAYPVQVKMKEDDHNRLLAECERLGERKGAVIRLALLRYLDEVSARR